MRVPDVTASADRSDDAETLTRLCRITLQFTSDAPADAVGSAEGRELPYIGSGRGTAEGARVGGRVTWSLYAGNCLYPAIRRGQPVPDGLHRCTLHPVGVIDTPDGARVRFEGRGYGLRSRERYLWSATLSFSTEAPEYEWLTKVLAVMTGTFDEQAGVAIWHVFVPRADVGSNIPLVTGAPSCCA